MKKQIKVTLFGAKGKRTLNITTLGGFLTRHIKAPREVVPSLFGDVQLHKSKPTATPTVEVSAPSTPAPVNPKSEPVNTKSNEAPPPTLLEVLKWMHASDNHSGWLIIDEILFVATTQYKMKFNHNTLLDALRLLYKKGCLEYRLNRFNQHTFRLIEKQENHLKSLLAEVDTILSKGGTV